MSQKLIFISHRTKDKSVGDMLLDFLSTTGIPRDAIKCSSLPGNDVKVKISSEVRDWIQHSVVNIAFLLALVLQNHALIKYFCRYYQGC